LGGDPGVGKSTLLLQAAASVATLSTIIPGIGMGPVQSGGDGDDFSPLGPVWYVSGEENPDQIANRALRLGMAESSELFLLGETHADSLCAQVVDHYERSQMLLDSKKQQKNADDDDDDVAVRAAAAVAAPSFIVIDSIQTMVCDAASGTAAGGVSQVRECVALFLRLAKSTGIPIMLVGHVTKSGQVAGPRTVEHVGKNTNLFMQLFFLLKLLV
jgi:DNA repair protein RadA/Sms